MTRPSSSHSEPIAIVGSGCRFPGGANSSSSLWELLQNPRDLRQEISPDRFNTTGLYHHDGARHGTTNVRYSYLLDQDIRVFDAAFFNISANEAEAIDPQQRLLLETVYEALEAGGHTLEGLRGSDTSVYVGTMTADYHDLLVRDANTIPKYFATGVNRAIISNRVSYFFDWHGPSMTIDTACSSSLIAVHQGVQSLRNRESQVSVACGTQVLLGYEMYIGESKLKMLSPNGRSRMWDADADGYARGEGVAAIVMKRLSDAIADGDHIECIIRETGANQDGFSNGLTVPSAEAQATLIRQTYAKAGLDPENNPHDRPQYFEAHGTGTQAGDPKEAAAIHEALGRHTHAESNTPLYVGSIKTVVGHLEGAAGLAGLLKASNSLQRGLIPPNLSFHRLNPKIEPFYKGLQVPTKLTRWPSLPEGVPRRVSVNSFGFGGANAHAILEEHVHPTSDSQDDTEPSISFSPFVFSALTETSLVVLLEQYARALKIRDGIDASDLAWTLHSRRSQHPTRVAFSATTIQQLSAKIANKLTAVENSIGTAIGIRSNGKSTTPLILGVFTGQGAQWPAMGAHLIRSSSFVRLRIQHLEESLASLSSADRPTWSLCDEMLAGDDTSRIAEAALSQPLCTAIQVVLVDLLQAAGITFASVVGHSSGEIAAAYAAGFLSAHDAIRVAYYRGLYARVAGNEDNGQKGAMLAVGMSKEDAQELVNLGIFQGRIALAAHNSSASVTLSGDFDAIIEAKKLLDKQKKFTRLLKVDTAYHSHHMLPCGDLYINALRACGIRIIREHDTTCTWYSSVIPDTKAMEPIEELQDVYWRDNMTSPVLFADAVRNAILSNEQINLVLEVGPHPALKGPATQNISDVRPTHLPYTGVLSRGYNDVEAFSDALGFIWTVFGTNAVDIVSFEKAVTGRTRAQKLVLDLPSYQWDHGRAHWSESRRSRKLRGRKEAPHELLGTLCPESNNHDMRWSNVLKVSEIPWMEHHQLQGLVVFPAAGYVAVAIEACRHLADDNMVELFELYDLSVPKAIIFEEGDISGVEILTTLTAIEHHSDQAVTAEFSIYSAPNVSTGSDHNTELVASGSVRILLGNPDPATLPSIDTVEDYNMTEVDPDRVYATFSKLGYGYTGPFKGMSLTKRRLNRASALVDTYGYSDDESTFYLVHPSMLDVAIQSSMLAYSSPGDGRLWSLHVPTNIGTVRVNPGVCPLLPTPGSQVFISTTLNGGSDVMSASIDIFSEDGQQGMIQVEDLTLKPFAPATEAEDRCMYLSTIVDVAEPDASSLRDCSGVNSLVNEAEVATACERISYYYVRKWKSEISDDQWGKGQPHHVHLRDFVDQTLSAAPQGQHPTLRRKWVKDTLEDIETLISKHSNVIDVRLLKVVGENIPATVRGKTTILGHMEAHGLLDEYYSKGLGLTRSFSFLAGLMRQITHRYPRANILEIGAGRTGATKSILDAVMTRAGATPSYTFTATLPGSLQNAPTAFNMYSDKMIFKVFDVEQSPAAQGYELHSYDVVVASCVLFTTTSLQRTLEHIRQLLKPGGYVVLLEPTTSDPIRLTTMMGGLPTWWRGLDNIHKYIPTMTPGLWHSVLRNAEFGGIDTITPKIEGADSAWPFSVMASQAVDDQVRFLRQPLSSSPSSIFIDSLVILGNKSLENSRITEGLADSLVHFCGRITILPDLPTVVEAQSLDPSSTFINLVDLDTPIFKNMTNDKMGGLKRLFELARSIMWVTRDVLVGREPYHAASLAYCRSLSNEMTHISFNALDISGLHKNTSRVISEQFLRQCALEEWGQQKFTWSQEPETFLHDGKLLLPRIMPNVDRNVRLNATRRVIVKTLPVSKSSFSIIAESDTSPLCLVQDLMPPELNKDKRGALVKIEYSTLMAHRVAPDVFLFLALGKRYAAGNPVVTLSTTNSRTVVPVVAIEVDVSVNFECLAITVASEFLAASMVHTLAPGSRILVNCSGKDQLLTAALSRRAACKAVQVILVCADDAQTLDKAWIRLSANAPRHIVRRKLLPLKPTHFLDLTTHLPWEIQPMGSVGLNIARVLPLSCRRVNLSDFSQRQASLPQLFDREALLCQLQDAASSANISMSTTREEHIQDMVIGIDRIHDRTRPHHTTSIVHWSVDGEVKVEVRSIDGRNLFSQDRTYILFGLSGQVGQSLCEWMVSNGAGCVCLTSRQPNIDQRWLDSFEGTTAMVKVLVGDITDRDSLDAMLDTVRGTCPPIAGVANGANVLNDAPFSSMSTEMMNQALRPKIDGSYNLDQAFYNDDLDFFVLFSSISCVIGTAGQSNYVAANGYLNGLAKQRRRRGLAASAFDMGLLLGIGVAQAAGQSVVDSLQKYAPTPLSETDVRQAFAESILAGYADARDEDPVIIPTAVMTSGLRTITTDETGIVWHSNPIFSHLVIDAKGTEIAAEQSRSKATALPLKEQIATAATKEEAFRALKECLSIKLRALLQSPELIITHDAPLVELGIDSLVAVEVRSWFMKMLKVDIPVLKLVGGSSLDEVCELTMKKLPESLVAQGRIDTATDSLAAPSKPVDASSQSQSPASTTLQPTKADTSSSSSEDEDSTSSLQNPPYVDTPASGLTQSTSSLQIPGKDDVRESTKPMLQASSGNFVKSGPMSMGQSRFWFLRLLVEDPTTFNVTLNLHLNGQVRIGDLERALRVVTARHESLRTNFIEDDHDEDQPSQNVTARSSIKMEFKTINSVEEVAAEYTQLRAYEFDLSSGPLLRLRLLTLSPTSHYLLINYHHIIMDMASFEVLTADLDKAYNRQSLGPPPRQYPDFSVAQLQAIEKGELNDELKYWQRVFPVGKQPPVLPLLPMARSNSRGAMTNYEVYQVSTQLEPALAARIKSVSKAQRSTPFHFYLAAFKAMLFSFTEAQDLTIGIADANRNDSDVINSIGFFLNLLPLRFRRQPHQSFAEAIVEARTTAYSALGNSRLPFDVLLEELNVERSPSHSPFFQAFFDYRQRSSDRQTFFNCQLELNEMHPGRTAYDISLDVANLTSDGVHITLRVQKGLYDLTAANLLMETYTHFVEIFAEEISLTLEATPLFGEKQLARAVQVGLGPDMISDWPATLPHRIDQVAQEKPDSTALIDGHGNVVSYMAMIKRIEAIAETLLEAGVSIGSRVLVFQQASADWICSMLAIMRIGGIYVPLDLRNPISRLVAQADHCQPSGLLADSSTITDATLLNVTTVINVSSIASAPLASASVKNSAHADAPAAILYTSGSTGTPKGIIIRHSGIRNEIEGYTKTYKLGAERVLQQSAFTFDFSVDQIFTGLANGGMLYVVPYSQRGDPLSITEVMRQQSITYTKVTPSEYSIWMQYGSENLRQASSWRFAFGGGEPLTKTILQQFSDLDLEQLHLYNSYGPAEISIASHKGLIDYRQDSLKGPLSEDRPVPCGFSLPNYATYVLDEHLKPLPAGMPGEVVIGGAGVSLGYLNNQELTTRVFLLNPYATPEYITNGWTRMHRTGDIGHLREDGSLVFRNRIAGDTQIKLRGLRIDLCDIEANIITTAFGILKEAIVTLREDGDAPYLVSHVVFDPQHNVDNKEAFLEHLLGRLPLPQYMIPVLAIPLDGLPLTNHSKVDRKAIKSLALPQRAASVDNAKMNHAELTETMVQLRQIWRQILPNSEKLGFDVTPSTSFFSIGGNSLLIVRLQARIRQSFNVAVRLVDLLGANTLGEMARKIEGSASIDIINWEQESAPPSIPSFLQGFTSIQETDTMTVLVTGATGNLAKRLIPLLSADPRVGKIHCVSVRDKPRQDDRFADPKVVCHFGDLSLPLLGLGVDEFRGLADRVDVILHLGASRSFWDNYHMLRSTNVHSTKELVKLAAPRRAPIHFISTSGVLPQEHVLAAGIASSAAGFEPPVDGSDGYVASKWASERVLERSAAGALAVPSIVYRLLPSSIPPHLQLELSKQEVLEEFVRCIDLAGAMPDSSGWEGRMDLVPASLVSQWICESMIKSVADQSNSGAATEATSDVSAATTQFFHHESPVTLVMNELRTYLEDQRGPDGHLERLSLLKWMGRIKAHGFAYILASQEATVQGSQGGAKLISRR